MSHSCDESYAVYTARTVRARKEHRCCACRDPIKIGHRYVSVFLVFGGTARTYKRCLRCQTIFAALVDELRKTDQWPDEDLNCGHVWGEEGGDGGVQTPVPDEIAALAFMSADEIQTLTPEAQP